MTSNNIFLVIAVIMDSTHQASLSMGFSRQEYQSGLPCPPRADLPNPGIEPSLLRCRWTLYHLGKAQGKAPKEARKVTKETRVRKSSKYFAIFCKDKSYFCLKKTPFLNCYSH